MKWISVNDSLPDMGVEVLGFRPNALLDYSDKPLRIVHRKSDGNFSGTHQVTHWLEIDTPPGWEAVHSIRQNN